MVKIPSQNAVVLNKIVSSASILEIVRLFIELSADIRCVTTSHKR